MSIVNSSQALAFRGTHVRKTTVLTKWVRLVVAIVLLAPLKLMLWITPMFLKTPYLGISTLFVSAHLGDAVKANPLPVVSKSGRWPMVLRSKRCLLHQTPWRCNQNPRCEWRMLTPQSPYRCLKKRSREEKELEKLFPALDGDAGDRKTMAARKQPLPLLCSIMPKKRPAPSVNPHLSPYLMH